MVLKADTLREQVAVQPRILLVELELLPTGRRLWSIQDDVGSYQLGSRPHYDLLSYTAGIWHWTIEDTPQSSLERAHSPQQQVVLRQPFSQIEPAMPVQIESFGTFDVDCAATHVGKACNFDWRETNGQLHGSPRRCFRISKFYWHSDIVILVENNPPQS